MPDWAQAVWEAAATALLLGAVIAAAQWVLGRIYGEPAEVVHYTGNPEK